MDTFLQKKCVQDFELLKKAIFQNAICTVSHTAIYEAGKERKKNEKGIKFRAQQVKMWETESKKGKTKKG